MSVSLKDYAGLERGAESSARRNRILDAAERLFAERGYAATSMRDIAQASGVNVATIYYYCPNKAQLCLSLYARVVERMTALVGETFAAGGGFAQVAVNLVNRVMEFFVTNPSIPRLFMRWELGEIPELGAERKDLYRPLFERVSEVIQDRIAAGQLRSVDAQTFVAGAAGVIFHLAAGFSRPDEGSVTPERLALIQKHARLFILGSLGLDPQAD
jgi:AcrR family transcriptional regulator